MVGGVSEDLFSSWMPRFLDEFILNGPQGGGAGRRKEVMPHVSEGYRYPGLALPASWPP